MDNKKWSKRFSTIFWWILTILPLIIALIYFIGYHLTFNSGITSATDLMDYHINGYGEFGFYLDIVLLDADSLEFEGLCIPYINTMFGNLFLTLGVTHASTFGILFGWMTSVQLYHVLYDVAVWLFRMFHDWLERWC